jgi:hypothetical protein
MVYFWEPGKGTVFFLAALIFEQWIGIEKDDYVGA